MKKLIAAVLVSFPLFVAAQEICPDSNLMFGATFESEAGTQRLCLDDKTNRWVFGTKGEWDNGYYYTKVSKVKPFRYTDPNTKEELKGYEVKIDNDRLIFAITEVQGKFKNSFLVVNDNQPEPFDITTVKYVGN